MDKQFYTLMEELDGRVWVLDLNGGTKQDSIRAIAWQRRGTNNQPMHTCEFDKESGMFISTEGKLFALPATRSCYTQEAWDKFLERLGMETRYVRAAVRKQGSQGKWHDEVLATIVPITGSFQVMVDAAIACINRQGWEVHHIADHSAKRDCV